MPFHHVIYVAGGRGAQIVILVLPDWLGVGNPFAILQIHFLIATDVVGLRSSRARRNVVMTYSEG